MKTSGQKMILLMVLVGPLMVGAADEAATLSPETSHLLEAVDAVLPDWAKEMHVPHWVSVSSETRNPRHDHVAIALARKFAEMDLVSILSAGNPNIEDQARAAAYAAQALGILETKSAREALRQTFQKLPDGSPVKRHVMNALVFRSDTDKDTVTAFENAILGTKERELKSFGLSALVVCSVYTPEVEEGVIQFLEQAATEGAMGDEWRVDSTKALVKVGEEARAVRCAMIMLKNDDEKIKLSGRDIIVKLGYLDAIAELKKITESTGLRAIRDTLRDIKRDERIGARSWCRTLREDMADSHALALKRLLKKLPDVPKTELGRIENGMVLHIEELRRLSSDSERYQVLPLILQNESAPASVRNAAALAKEAISARQSKRGQALP